MVLDIKKVSKQYPHADGVVDAIKDVSLSVPESEFVTITGPSGSGKSTLLLSLGGLIRLTSGEMYFRGDPLHSKSDSELAAFRRDRIGFVMQNFALVPYLTAAQNVMIQLSLQKVAFAEQTQKAESLLKSVALYERRNHLPRELSIGQQQRVAIARAFANDPDLILADEPTGNLDPSLSEDILGLLEQLNREKGTTIIMVTHSPSAAERGSVRVHLAGGRIVEHRSTSPSEESPVATG